MKILIVRKQIAMVIRNVLFDFLAQFVYLSLIDDQFIVKFIILSYFYTLIN